MSMEGFFDIGEAARRLKDGKRVTNTRLSPSGGYLYLVNSSSLVVNRPPLDALCPGATVAYSRHVDVIAPLASGVLNASVHQFSQEDVLAEDWFEV
jgi:hypothetical protein